MFADITKCLLIASKADIVKANVIKCFADIIKCLLIASKADIISWCNSMFADIITHLLILSHICWYYQKLAYIIKS
jgi:hypothetical protein